MGKGGGQTSETEIVKVAVYLNYAKTYLSSDAACL